MATSAGRVVFAFRPLGADVASDFYTVAPCRLFDSRTGPALSSPTTIQSTGVCTVPSQANAVTLNLTAIVPSEGGHITAYTTAEAAPAVSTLDFNAGQTRANDAIVRLSAGGAFDIAPVSTSPPRGCSATTREARSG